MLGKNLDVLRVKAKENWQDPEHFEGISIQFRVHLKCLHVLDLSLFISDRKNRIIGENDFKKRINTFGIFFIKTVGFH